MKILIYKLFGKQTVSTIAFPETIEHKNLIDEIKPVRKTT